MLKINRSLLVILITAITLFSANNAIAVELAVELPDKKLAKLHVLFQNDLKIESKYLPASFKAGIQHPTGNWLTFQDLNQKGKLWLLHTLFPNDIWSNERVVHVVRWPEIESVWLMSLLFIGNSQGHDLLQLANPSNSEKLKIGDRWIIPEDLLSKELSGRSKSFSKIKTAPSEDTLSDYERMIFFRSLLTFDKDKEGKKFAYYRMRKGEALYSNVVMRYTDQIDHSDVNELALEIAKHSGISDVRKIQPGHLVKIPLNFLASPFQPKGTSAFAEEQKLHAELKRVQRTTTGTRLKGIHIVIDAGHGGIDRGAVANGVWESDYVYDIAMRVRRLLEHSTDATVSCTIRYPDLGFNPRNWIDAPSNYAEILTNPPFINDGESANSVSVNLRWILANQLFATSSRDGDYKKTLFLSFHADSLHPSARGTMVYVPGAAGVPASFTLPYTGMASMRKLNQSNRITFTPTERLQSEVRSRMLAESLLDALQAEGIPTHVNRPIRNVVLRNGKSFIPAVIRYSSAATKVLLEVLNLTNRADADNLKSHIFREHYAQAIVKGIKTYYRK